MSGDNHNMARARGDRIEYAGAILLCVLWLASFAFLCGAPAWFG